MLNNHQKELYLRNIIVPEIEEKGQKKILESKVLIIGAGGLGSSAIYYLAAAGVGNIGIVDDDRVELSNLQRQIIHNLSDLNKLKCQSAKEKVTLLNPNLQIDIYPTRVDENNLKDLVQRYDFILDCTDNFPTRFIINRVCFLEKKPLIFAAVKQFFCHISVFKAYLDNNPCYNCFNGNVYDSSFSLPLREKGILGSVAGTGGAMQATEVIKEILNIGHSLVGKMMIFDFLQSKSKIINLKKNINCKICS
ncbi:MAG: molybdopterin/thiamine biosynthesis adenylyltransferase [Rickettsiales bacterium]|jgi:molybdopterin/thiamine biosynthesis adenylyltransferase